LSVVYKALDNMGAYQRWFGFQPDTKAAGLMEISPGTLYVFLTEAGDYQAANFTGA